MRTKHGMTHSESLAAAQDCRPAEQEGRINQEGTVTVAELGKKFLEYFESLEGGAFVDPELPESNYKKKKEDNRRTKAMVENVLQEVFGNEPFQFERLRELSYMARQKDSPILRLKEGRKWGTVRNQISAFIHFIDFLESCFPAAGLPINAMKTSFTGVLRSVSKMVARETAQRQLESIEHLIPGDLISTYKNKKMAQSIIRSMEEAQEYTDEDVIRLRNHLALEIAFRNAKRTGILSDITIGNLLHPQKTFETGDIEILVGNGKTFPTNGAAGIHIPLKLKKSLLFFNEYLHPECDQEESKLFFGCTTSDINKSFQIAWEDFGRTYNIEVPHITGNIIRKSVVTISRESGASREDQHVIAKHMNHSLPTADKHYEASAGLHYTKRFSDIINEHIPEDESESEKPKDDVVLKPMPKTKQQKMKFGKPEVFSDEDKNSIRKACEDYVDSCVSKGKPFRKEVVWKLIKDAGLNHLFETYTKGQLYSRARNDYVREKGLKSRKENPKKI